MSQTIHMNSDVNSLTVVTPAGTLELYFNAEIGVLSVDATPVDDLRGVSLKGSNYLPENALGLFTKGMIFSMFESLEKFEDARERQMQKWRDEEDDPVWRKIESRLD